MKKIAAIFLAAIVSMSLLAASDLDNPRVSAKFKKEPMTSVIRTLERQTGWSFIYRERYFKSTPKVTATFNDAGLQEVLNAVIQKPLRYEIRGHIVVISLEDKPFEEKSIAKVEQTWEVLADIVTDTITESRITDIRKVKNTQAGLERINSDKIMKNVSLLGSPDIIKSLQRLPGVASGTEAMSGLFVHGGDGSDNMFRINGIPIYQVTHFGGFYSSFNADVVENIDFYKAGFPARFGGRLSSVVDVYTRDGDMQNYHGVFNIGIIDGRLQYEGPIVKDKISFNLAARRSWIDLFTVPIVGLIRDENNGIQGLGYKFYDYNGRMTWRISSSDKLNLDIYHGRDALNFQMKSKQGREQNVTSDNLIASSWGNLLISLNYSKIHSDRLHSDTRMYFTQNPAGLHAKSNETTLHTGNVATIEEILHDDEKGNSRVMDTGISSDWIFSPGRHKVRFGGEIISHRYHIGSESFINHTLNGEVQNARPSAKAEADYKGGEAAVYIEDEFPIFRILDLNLGLRGVGYLVDRRTWWNLEPRAALKLYLPRNIDIKASYSRMSQFSHRISPTYIDLPCNVWVPSTPDIRPMTSDQYAAGVYFHLPHNVSLKMEGWYKNMDNLTEYIGSSSFEQVMDLWVPADKWESTVISGKGRSYGAEFEADWHTNKTEVNIAYTLSWSQRHFPEIWHKWFYDRNDNRHNFSVTASHRFSRKFDIYGGWTYHSGNRMTIASNYVWDTSNTSAPNEFYDAPNNLKLPDYHRLDLGFNFSRTTRRGNISIWNVNIYNAYCRMNVINAQVWLSGEYVEGKGTIYENVKVKGLGIIPIIPSFSWTLKF